MVDTVLADILAKHKQSLHDAYLIDYDFKRYEKQKKDEEKKRLDSEKKESFKQLQLF